MESATSAAAASGYTLRVVRINAWRVYNNEKQQMKQKKNLYKRFTKKKKTLSCKKFFV